MRISHCRTWSMARKPKIMENEKHTLYDMKYGENHTKMFKIKNAHVGTVIWRENRKTQKMRNTHCTTCNMARNTQKRPKWEMHMVGPGVWREK